MRLLVLSLLLLTALGCQPEGHVKEGGVTRMALPANAREVDAAPRQVARGQLLYVPCYSHIYLMDGKPYNLAITLSFRNTSDQGKLVIQSIAYHDSTGKLVKELAPREIEMAPLSSAEAFVHEEDQTGGSGAAFLVRWVAETEITDPVVEAAMVGSSGALGVSFLTSSRVLEKLP